MNKIWRKKISYEDIIKLIDFWIENYPNKLREIPSELKRIISKEDVDILQRPYRINGKISPEELEELRDKFELKLTSIEKTYRDEDWQHKQIFWNKILVMTTVLLALTSIWMVWNSNESLRIQSEGIPPINPKMVPTLVTEDYNQFFPTFYLIDLYHDANWSFWPRTENIGLYVRNSGQSPGSVNFYMKDSEDLFVASSERNGIIEPFNYKYIDFKIRYNGCFSGSGEENYKKLKKEECNYKNLSTGLKKWFFKIDCQSCQSEINPKCYSFNICVYNESQQERWCLEKFKDNDFELIETECPDPWW